MTVWVCILLLFAFLFYLNQVGLPGFVKKPLLQKLRAHGVDLQFSRLRIRWTEGIVAEDVRFGRPDSPSSPSMSLREVQVQVNARALASLRLQIDGLVLRQGKLVWPLAETNRELSIDKIQTDLRFLPDDQWALDNFRAVFAGINFQLSGVITHASVVREWPLLQPKPGAPGTSWERHLEQLFDYTRSISFLSPPELTFDLQGDARNLQSFRLRMLLKTPGAQTPWGTLSGGQLSAQIHPATGTTPSRGELILEAAEAQTRWASVTNLQLVMHLVPDPARSNVVQGTLTVAASQMESPRGSANNARLSLNWLHALTNAVPMSGQGEFQCEQAHCEWGTADKVNITAHLVEPGGPVSQVRADDSWGPWAALRPYHLNWEARLQDVESQEMKASEVALNGLWDAPVLKISKLSTKLSSGEVKAQGDMNVATRALHIQLSSSLDPRAFKPLVPEPAQKTLAQLAWNEPPKLFAEFGLRLPAWTNRQPDWQGEIQPTLNVSGELRFDHPAAYRGITILSGHSHFTYSNQVFALPDLTVAHAKGWLEAGYVADGLTKNFYWRVRSTIDPAVVRPLLGEKERQAFDLVSFSQGPDLNVEIWGRSDDSKRIGFKGRVAVTNFVVRGESVSGVQTAFQYTNRVLEFFGPRVQRGAQNLSADGLTADFNTQVVYLTNGFSTAEPRFIAHIIGPDIEHTIQPYQFHKPPVARVYGAIPMYGEDAADLHFDLNGGPFHWWRFTVPQISAHVHWRAQHLEISNVHMDFYGGKASGAAAFDFLPNDGADFRFNLTTTNTILQFLLADYSSKTNNVEGRLSGTVYITRANTDRGNDVDGYGSARLTDGLLWDIPLFGVFSPVLDNIAPGLGNSRASAATATFNIKNGVLHSEDMEIRASGMRLKYRGNVDLSGNLNARVDAELLRDMWLVGPVVSTIFWPVSKMFEFKVTGTLEDPKKEPVYLLPKMMLFPFHRKGSAPEEQSPSTSTNAPPVIR
jgi:hypothetical protein